MKIYYNDILKKNIFSTLFLSNCYNLSLNYSYSLSHFFLKLVKYFLKQKKSNFTLENTMLSFLVTLFTKSDLVRINDFKNDII